MESQNEQLQINSNGEGERLNDKENNKNSDTLNTNQNDDLSQNYQISESTVNIELSEAATSETLNTSSDNVITESTINIQSSDEKNFQDSSAANSAITESTLVISSTYQPNDENNTSYVDIDNNNDNNNRQVESNTNSMIIANASSGDESSSSSSPSSMSPSPIDKEFPTSQTEEFSDNNQKEERDTERGKTTSNIDSDDVENLVKGYEIPNMEEESEKKKSKRNLEEETFLKVLGNDSLMKKITQYGVEDDEPNARPLNGQMVTISYDAFLKENMKLVDHNENLSFILGDGDVISGLDMVVSLMNRNEKCEVIVEARHAYGSRGREPDVPSEATLVYNVHLIDFKDLTPLNEMKQIERLSLAEAKKLRGNYHFNRKDYYLAIVSYKKGLKYFDEENLRTDEEQEDLAKYKELTQSLLMNIALSYFKMESLRDALDSLDQVLSINSKHLKGLYIKGRVLLAMGETQQSVQTFNRAIELDPNNPELKKELVKAQAKHKQQYQNEKNLYKKMISGVTNESVEKKDNKKLKTSLKTKNNESSTYTTFIAAGIAIALVSVGIAIFSKYRN